ncbi:hypothetical protein HS7_06910 [Sulfolobales archaeon HS-7]|nr:hypothetical protein HS7_06910 [Sulfolobales archaeon HS-7]
MSKRLITFADFLAYNIYLMETSANVEPITLEKVIYYP